MNARRVAHIKSSGNLLFPISTIPAPNITGMLIKNENFIADFSSNPLSNPDEIVLPDLEIPGKIANACANPIQTASIQLGSFFLFSPKSSEAIINIIEVIAKPNATTLKLEKADSKKSLNKYPIIAAGIEETIIKNPILASSLFHFP